MMEEVLLNSSFREKGQLLWPASFFAFSLRGIIESVERWREVCEMARFNAFLCVPFTKPFCFFVFCCFFFLIIMSLILFCWIGVLFCG